MSATIQPAVVGATGYTGAELARLLSTHPRVRAPLLLGGTRDGAGADHGAPAPGSGLPSERFSWERVKEAGVDTPEIMVASGSAPTAGSDAPTIARDSALASGPVSRSRPDADALTIAAPIEAMRGADAEVPARSEALFGTTQHELPPEPPKSRVTAVLLVAMAALALGLIGGLMFLRRADRGLEDQKTMRLPDPAAPPAEAAATERPTKAAAPPELAPVDSAMPVDSALPEASALPAPSAAPAGGPPVKEQVLDAGVDAAASVAPDGGWQKPDWAIPDDEIPVRRGPGEADEKIVLPPQ